MIETLSSLELAYGVAVVLFSFALRTFWAVRLDVSLRKPEPNAVKPNGVPEIDKVVNA